MYTSGSENEYFEWKDRTEATARQLADTFVERFSDIAEAGKGWDWLYAGWFVEMLGVAEAGYFPYVYADYEVEENNGLNLNHVEEPNASGPKPVLPLPPPGECDSPADESTGGDL